MRVNFYIVSVVLLIFLLLFTRLCVKYVNEVNLKSSLLVGIYLLMILNMVFFIHTVRTGKMYEAQKQGTNIYEVKSIRERVVNTTGFSISREKCEEIEVDNLEYPVLEEEVYIGLKDYLFMEVIVYENKYILKIPKGYL